MRIAYFNANLRVGQDGVTRVVYKMIEGALARGHEVVAVTATLPAGEPLVPMLKVPSVVLPLQRNYRIAVPGYTMFEKYLAEFRPDVLHINSPCTLGFGAVKYAREFNVPIVATYHTHFPTYPRYYNLTKLEAITWRLMRRLYNNVDRTFVPARPVLDDLAEHGLHGLEYFPNGVDTKIFHPGNRSEEWRSRFGKGENPIILFVSRLVWEKDLAVLADMYRILRTRRDDFEMVVVGDGHAREEFQEMMPGAHFLGYQTGKPLAESFASADIFVFPSTTETFGLVTLEAMASGLAPVAAKVGGAVELIEENRSGLFAEPLNAEDLANKTENLLEHPILRTAVALNAVRRAQQYEWTRILDQLFTSYADVIATSRRKRIAA